MIRHWRWPFATLPVGLRRSLVIVLPLVFLLDFMLRIGVWDVGTDRVITAPTPAALPTASPGAEILKPRLLAYLPKVAVDEPQNRERAFVLLGVFRYPDGLRAAFRLESNGAAPVEFLMLAPGAIIEGWMLDRVDQRSVTLTKDQQTRTITLFDPPTGEPSR
jgi:hypothetical protein